MKRQWMVLSVLAASSAVAWSQPPPRQPQRNDQQQNRNERVERRERVRDAVRDVRKSVSDHPSQGEAQGRKPPTTQPIRPTAAPGKIYTPSSGLKHPPLVPPGMERMKKGKDGKENGANDKVQEPVARTPEVPLAQPPRPDRKDLNKPSHKMEPRPVPGKVTPFVPKDIPGKIRDKVGKRPVESVHPVKTPASDLSSQGPPPPEPPPNPGHKISTGPPIEAGKAPGDTLNRAAKILLGREVVKKPLEKPKLTPWIAPHKDDHRPQHGAPTPTPAPHKIIIDPEHRADFMKRIHKTRLVPTPPPVPTPGRTPVPMPPGVTPVPRDFKPSHDWTPPPGWKPPSNWQPPKGWVPPGGWNPPPGWNPPADWIPKLRKWGWHYIPRRGWVVDVRWTPPPDFVVPPGWYYLPPSAYDDYGLYDPGQVAILPGAGRSDLRVNINLNTAYVPPAPPPVVLQEAPPPPRPLPPEPVQVPGQVTDVQQVVSVLSRPRVPDGPRYQGPVLVSSSVHFDYDQYAIKPESFPTLDAVGQALTTELPDAIINVEGHTDSDGSDDYNQTLSEERAWSVKSYLVQKFGIDPNRLNIVGYGETAPIASNDTDQGKAENRRVEFENVTDLYNAQVIDTDGQ